MLDSTQITDNITMYAKTNYKRFRIEGAKSIRSETFSGFIKAEVKLSRSIKKIEEHSFEKCSCNYAKQVLVPIEEIKTLVKNSGYPLGSIKMYQP